MRITVDVEQCIGSGQCVVSADAVFDQADEDGRVVVLDESPSADQLENVREAVRVCPARAIHLDEQA
jgi:ferredoxin